MNAIDEDMEPYVTVNGVEVPCTYDPVNERITLADSAPTPRAADPKTGRPADLVAIGFRKRVQS